MWLLDTSKYTLTQTLYPEKYAILSHTWEDGEVTFQDIKDPAVASQKAGWVKIVQTCRLAKGQGFDRVWIDTCCIDKSSSAELSEAINSMFQWYKNADVCYVWLSDLPRAPDGPNSQASQNQLERDLPRCRWFTRGWTLQELIAPRNIKFYDRGWVMRGTKLTLVAQLADITNIAFLLLYNMSELYEYPVARRMSWAAKRQTTRLEDAAYCLLGIFEVNMPMIYGEGERAFQRLQEAIALSSNDMSLFAWSGGPGAAMPFHGIIARSPSQFAQCTKIVNNYEPLHYDSRSFAITNRGVEF
ncbi:heterokaryon incompatibility protein-domain-containing protein, partial [Podospora didyma]